MRFLNRTIILLILFWVSLISCTDESTKPETSQSDELNTLFKGTWKTESVILDKGDGPIELSPDIAQCGGTLNLYESGEFEYEYYFDDSSSFQSGNWSAKNSLLNLFPKNGNDFGLKYTLLSDRDFVLPRDTIYHIIDGSYKGTQANITFLIVRQLNWSKDESLKGKWSFATMDIVHEEQITTITNENLFIQYTLDFQESWFRLDSIVTGDTRQFTDDNWFVADGKIVADNDFRTYVWNYRIINDTLNIKFRGLHEQTPAIFEQSFIKQLN